MSKFIGFVNSKDRTMDFGSFDTAREVYQWAISYLDATRFRVYWTQGDDLPIGEWVCARGVWQLQPYERDPRR